MQGLPKSSTPFWRRPEGVVGLLFLLAITGGIGYLVWSSWAAILAAMANTVVLGAAIAALGLVVFAVADPKTRALIAYMYKGAMRKIAGLFVQIDPIGILRSYVDEMVKNLNKLREQIGNIRGQMRHLRSLIEKNEAEIANQLSQARKAKQEGKQQPMILSSRKAARLKESNQKYNSLLGKLDILYRILKKMHDNSEVLLEDTKDQVKLKTEERKAIRASHSAMKSAMSVINGDPDQRAMFDQAMEAITEDVANKVGEMERFMEMSSTFMSSIDLQQGVFEEQGLKMLEAYEKESFLLLGDGQSQKDTLDINARPAKKPREIIREQKGKGGNTYDQFF